jgi:hypothetical protein
MESEMTDVYFHAVWEGPAMLPATVTETAPGKYTIAANLTDPGAYKLRVTLMYEHSWYAYGPSKAKQAFFSQSKHADVKASWLQPNALCRPLLVGGVATIEALANHARREDARVQRLQMLHDIPDSLLPTYTKSFKPMSYGVARLLTDAGMKFLKDQRGIRAKFPRLQEYERAPDLVEVGGDSQLIRAEFKLAVHTVATVATVRAVAGGSAIFDESSGGQLLRPCRGFGIDVPPRVRADYGRWVVTPRGPVWRPLGCMAKTYWPDDIADCIARTPVVIVGDSHSRELDEELKQSLVMAEIGRCTVHRPVQLPLGRNYNTAKLDYHTPTSADSAEQVACKKQSQAITKQTQKNLGFCRIAHFGINNALVNWDGLYNWSVALSPDKIVELVESVRLHAFHRKLKFILISIGSWNAVNMDAEQIFDQWKMFIDMLLATLWKDEESRSATIVWRSQAAYGHRRGPPFHKEHRTNAKIAKLWDRQKVYIAELQARDGDQLRAAGLSRPRIVVHDDFSAMLPYFHNTADTTHFARFGVDDHRHDWEWPFNTEAAGGGACGGGVGELLECPFGNRGSNAVGMSTANSLLNSICAPDE